MSITVEQLATELDKIFDLYSDEVADILKKAAKQTAKETNENVKSNVTFQNRTGQYVKNFAIKKTYESHRSVTYYWYVKAPYYRLTHLLEYGHATKNGGRTDEYPHIAKGEKYAIERMQELLEVLLDAIS